MDWSFLLKDKDALCVTTDSRKVLIDGVLYIIRDGKVFNATGAQVR